MASLGEMFVNIGIDSSKLQNGLKKIEGSLKGAGSKMKSVGSSMTKNVTAPLIGLAGISVKLATDFEAGMSKVQAVSGATADDMIKLKEKAKEMGATTKFSATESAEAMNYMALNARAVMRKLIA
jgi:phage-related minor tail protein